ncbi:histidine protein methyltransferase 1 homolog [Convolutriloba macropyga]|uniref:histidine protein methyltransferase 1 homolog n=1 Tax=Convolutriloba macropyga TaxID=536237 RepID=UPI003F521DA7
MFQFNFNSNEDTVIKDSNGESKRKNEKAAECRVHRFSAENAMSLNQESFLSVELVNCKLSYLKNRKTRKNSEYSLVSQKYEGGCEVWESTIDLLKFLSSKKDLITGKNVLDLGCGSGLLGLFCLQNGAESVTFQDFNSDVIDDYLIQNLAANVDDLNVALEKCRFVSGDWNDAELISNLGIADVIVSSETLYDVSNYSALNSLFDKVLTANGAILLASKVHYFGVGGSINQFIETVSTHFSCEVVHSESNYGVGRQIVRLRRKLEGCD